MISMKLLKNKTLQKSGSDKKLKDHFNLTISDPDKKAFAAFTKKYPKPKTSTVILALIRQHMKGEPQNNA